MNEKKLNINANTIYKIVGHIWEDEEGCPVDVDVKLETVNSDTIPNDGNIYLVPITLTNHLNESRLALANCSPDIQYFHEPFYFIEDESKLINVRETEFLSGDTYSLESLQELEGYEESLEETSSHFPNDVRWEHFFPPQVIPGIGYVFIPGQVNLEAFENLPENASDEQETKAAMNTQILHKVQMPRVPKNIFPHYIPIKVFSETQCKEGYAYFDGSAQKVLDLHFFDEKGGQVSVVHTPEKVEDLGFFINKEILSYEFLLPEVEPIRYRFVIK